MIVFLYSIFINPAFSLTVILDPGHGGSDHGATHNGATESSIVLDISEQIKQSLDQTPDIKAHLTRTDDRFLSLEERTNFAHQKSGQLFLSIHCNSSPEDRAKGKEIYFQNQLPPDEESLFLANLENNGAQSKAVELPDVAAIVEDLERNQRLSLSGKFSEYLHSYWQGSKHQRARPIRQAPFYVVSNVKMPSALIEIGYLSNVKEAAKLTDKGYQAKIAEGIALSIRKFKEFMDKRAPTTLD